LHFRRATPLAETHLEKIAEGLFSLVLSTAKIRRLEALLLSFGIKRERSAHESALDRGWRCVPADFREAFSASLPAAKRECGANRQKFLMLRPCLGRSIDANWRQRRPDCNLETPSSDGRLGAIGKRVGPQAGAAGRGAATTAAAGGA
jgi:hypothetical protein